METKKRNCVLLLLVTTATTIVQAIFAALLFVAAEWQYDFAVFAFVAFTSLLFGMAIVSLCEFRGIGMMVMGSAGGLIFAHQHIYDHPVPFLSIVCVAWVLAMSYLAALWVEDIWGKKWWKFVYFCTALPLGVGTVLGVVHLVLVIVYQRWHEYRTYSPR